LSRLPGTWYRHGVRARTLCNDSSITFLCSEIVLT
jgi:hypothetical protein